MEHRRVRRVAVDAIHAAGRDDLDRRRMRFHVADLDRRSLRAQNHAALDVEGVLHRARRMIFRRIERREIVEVVLDLGTIRDFEAKRAEQGFDTIERARDRMERADTKTASGKRDIQRIGGERARQLCVRQRRAPRVQRRLQLGLRFVDRRAGGGALGGGQLGESLQLFGERARLAEIACLRVFERRRIVALREFGQRRIDDTVELGRLHR